MKGRQKGDEVNYVEAKDFFKESKRLVIWQPSGEFSQGRLTFTVAVKAGHRDSTLDVNPSASGYGAIRLDDDEMDFELTREDLQINMEDWNAMNFYLQVSNMSNVDSAPLPQTPNCLHHTALLRHPAGNHRSLLYLA
eukprot:TRINITY_DN1373_c0_g1_i10.p1 TRINITY_DN1373_c0_g1~~TRINITY_DN1373_c0_g1_i10.p1  ORF type:complete len:154 (-),score=15.78 TRINITY_DN1373_c0_g1_i10:494-904(-)